MKRKHEDLMKMALMATASALAGQILKPIVEHGVTVIKTKMLYMVDISDSMGGIGGSFKEIFPNYPERVEFHSGESEYILKDPVKIDGLEWNFSQDYIDFTIFAKAPIMIKIAKFQKNEHGYSSPDGAYLITFNTKWNRMAMKKLLHRLYELSRQEYVKNFFEREHNVKTVTIENNRGETDWLQHKLRTFDDVFIPAEQKKYLIESVEAYVNNRDFYVKNNIPNHFGILLYSEPGHGKSSIAQAIASHINAELTVINGDNIKHIKEIIRCMGTHSMDDNIYRVLLFEDIDSGLFNLTREKSKKDEDKDEVGMATILNALDGIGSPTNVIYIFTTNHVEALDPAFIRPGRCDIHLEIKGATPETLKDFIEFHYNISDAGPLIKKLQKGHCITPGLTFAKLQTLVMEGQSAEDVIEFAYGY